MVISSILPLPSKVRAHFNMKQQIAVFFYHCFNLQDNGSEPSKGRNATVLVRFWPADGSKSSCLVLHLLTGFVESHATLSSILELAAGREILKNFNCSFESTTKLHTVLAVYLKYHDFQM